MEYQPIWSQIVADLPPTVTAPTVRELMVALEFIGSRTDTTAADYLKFREEWGSAQSTRDAEPLFTFAGPSKITKQAIARAQELNAPLLVWIRERHALILPSDSPLVATQRWIRTDARAHLSDQIAIELGEIPLDKLIEYDSMPQFAKDGDIYRNSACPCCKDETWSFRLRSFPGTDRPYQFICDACGANGDAITWRIIQQVLREGDDITELTMEESLAVYTKRFNAAVDELIVQHRSGEFL